MQLNFTRLIYSLSISFLLLSQIAHATTPDVHISPEPQWINILKPYNKGVPSRKVENGYFYQLYEEQIQVEKQANYNHVIRQIVSDEGIQNGSEISISFDPSYERIDFHKLIVWRNNQPQDRLKAGAFKVTADEKELSRFLYQGSYSAFCILDDIRKGDRIEYSYTITGRNPIFGNKYFRDLYLQLGVPVAHIYKSVFTSPSRVLHIKSFNKVPKAVITDKNGLKCYEWEDFQVEPFEDYDNEPGWYNGYNYVQVSDYNNWKEVVDWGLSINPLPQNLSGGLATQITTLKQASHGDKIAYFRSAVKLVQNEVRYMGIEIGQYSHKANNPERVFTQRYGDCKDKSLLLASILHAGGIDANLVLINSSVKGGIDQLQPSPNDFDHCVVVANLNGKQVWIDPTISYQGGTGTNLYFPDYGKGLVLKAGNDALTAIPPSATGKITCREQYVVKNEKDSVDLEVVTNYTLDHADFERERLASAGMTQTEKDYLAYYQKIYPKMERVDSVTVRDDIDKNTLTTIEHYKIAGFFKPDTENVKFKASFYADFVSDQLTHVPNSVKGPVALNYPYDLDYTTIVVLPINWNHDNTTFEKNINEFRFKSDYTASGDTLYLHHALKYMKDFVPANRLDDYRQAVKDIEDNGLSYSFNYIPDVNKVPVNINYMLLALVIAIVAGSVLLGLRIYRSKTPPLIFQPGETFVPIGGWLILITIGLVATVLTVIYQAIEQGYFNMHYWNTLPTTMTLSGYRLLLTIGLAGNTIMACLAAFCLILLFKKRDILPKYITAFYVYNLVYAVLFLFLAIGMHESGDHKNAAQMLIRSIVACAIWVPYFRMSKRVRQTFVVPYPENNYHYEQWTNYKENTPAPPAAEN